MLCCAVQFVDAAERLLSSIRPELFMVKPVTRVALLFGSSPHRSCEVYDICIRTDQHAEPVTGAHVMSLLRN
jgi:hypothetical protein